jgi:hypothetical protein
MSEFYIPDAAARRADRIDLTTDALLASKGFDPANANPINAPKIVGEAFEDETIYDVDRFTWRPEKDEEAISGTRQSEQDAELSALLKRSAAREALKVRDLSSDRAFRAAVLRGDTRTAQRIMLDVVRDNEAPYALRVACITALVEIAPDDGSDYNGAWLHRMTGLPLRTCQDLISSSRSLIAGLAAELVGTDDESRAGVRAIGEMSPAVQRRVVEAVRAFRTKRLLALATKREKARRVRGISLAELRMLAPIGLCNEEGWAAMTELSTEDSREWLSEAFDKFTATAERKGGVVEKPAVSKPKVKSITC